MLKTQQPVIRGRWLAFAAACGAGLGLDLWTKQWAWDTLRGPGGEAWVVWPSVLEMDFAFNLGSAFGVLPRVDYPLAIAVITALLIGWVLHATREAGAGRLRGAAAGLIAAGALGNLHDRLLRVDELGRHGVVDFIRVHLPWGTTWPSFNVADALLVVGVVLLMWTLRGAGERAQVTSEAVTS